MLTFVTLSTLWKVRMDNLKNSQQLEGPLCSSHQWGLLWQNHEMVAIGITETQADGYGPTTGTLLLTMDRQYKDMNT